MGCPTPDAKRDGLRQQKGDRYTIKEDQLGYLSGGKWHLVKEPVCHLASDSGYQCEEGVTEGSFKLPFPTHY